MQPEAEAACLPLHAALLELGLSCQQQSSIEAGLIQEVQQQGTACAVQVTYNECYQPGVDWISGC